MNIQRITTDPNLLHCRYCGYKCRRIYRKKGGQVMNGWRKLRSHMEIHMKHDQQYRDDLRTAGFVEEADDLDEFYPLD